MPKRVISFSLWGDNTLYTHGAVKNAHRRAEFYPDWVCRFYVDETTTPTETLKELESIDGTEVKRMGHIEDVLGMYWRFHPMFDDTDVERFIVRDTDSQFTHREAEAVNEWVVSGKPFHIIRDNVVHNIPILGGTWGAVAGCILKFQEYMDRWLARLAPDWNNPRGLFHGSDQFFLQLYVWPLIKGNHVAHIREGEESLRFADSDRYFSTPVEKENGHYVGMVTG